MNQKTAKLLKKWAAHAKKDQREVKRWWNAMTHTQRGIERKKIEAQLA